MPANSWKLHLAVVLCALVVVLADEDHGEYVLPYNGEFFASEIPKGPHLVMFYAPW